MAHTKEGNYKERPLKVGTKVWYAATYGRGTERKHSIIRRGIIERIDGSVAYVRGTTEYSPDMSLELKDMSTNENVTRKITNAYNILYGIEFQNSLKGETAEQTLINAIRFVVKRFQFDNDTPRVFHKLCKHIADGTYTPELLDRRDKGFVHTCNKFLATSDTASAGYTRTQTASDHVDTAECFKADTNAETFSLLLQYLCFHEGMYVWNYRENLLELVLQYPELEHTITLETMRKITAWNAEKLEIMNFGTLKYVRA